MQVSNEPAPTRNTPRRPTWPVARRLAKPEGRYDEWLADERERLAGLYLEALERLARQYEGRRRLAGSHPRPAQHTAAEPALA